MSAIRRNARLARIIFFVGFRAAPGWMAAITVLLVLGSVAATCYPLGYRLLVDGALAGSTGRIAGGVAVVAGLQALGWVLLAIGATETLALSDRIAVYLTSHLIELTGGVPGLEHLERPGYLAQIERINAGRRQLASAPQRILGAATMVIRAVTLLALLGAVSPWLLLLPVAAVPPLAGDRIARKITKRAEDAVAADRRLATMIFDLSVDTGAAGELRCYGLSRQLAAMHAGLVRSLDRSVRSQALRVLTVQSVSWLLYAAGAMAAIGFVVVRASDGAITLGTVVMTVSLIQRSRAQLTGVAFGSGALVTALTAADRLLWLEDHHRASLAAAGTLPAPAGLRSGIAVRGLSFTYPGTERSVLTDLSLFLPAGSTVAVVGENGSGKTTLVKLLLGMYQPTGGEILLDDVPLGSISPAAWRERCTAAFQDFSRLSLPAVSSVGVADLPDHASEPRALDALDRAGGAELPGQLPAGLATYVGGPDTGGHELSGGQWQKVALGRAMRTVSPLLVVLDEPTASLDPQAEHELFSRYAAASAALAESGAITLLVSHRLSTVQMADLIVYLDAGNVVEAGSHAELMAAGGHYAEVFALQAAGYS